MRLLTAGEVDARRAARVVDAQRLDGVSLGMERGAMNLAAGVLGVLAAMAAVFMPRIHTGLAMLGCYLAWPLILGYLGVDLDGRGSLLRRVLPLRRRDVATARFRTCVELSGLFTAGAILVLGVGAARHTPWVGDAATCVLLIVTSFWGTIVVGVPSMAARLPRFLVLLGAVISGGMTFATVGIGWEAYFDGDFGMHTAAHAYAAAFIGLVLAVLAAASWRLSVHVYERKDL